MRYDVLLKGKKIGAENHLDLALWSTEANDESANMVQKRLSTTIT